MKLPLPFFFTRVILLTSLCVATIVANAATFTSNKSGTWSNADIWTITNGTSSTGTIPGPYDDVFISNDHIINVDTDIFITRLTINGDGPASSPKDYTKFNLNGYSMLVEFINLIGGTNDKKMAELNLGGGLIEVMGPTTNLTQSGFSAINLGTTPPPASTPGEILFNAINPLPVELTKFTATKKPSEVALAWETASEKNNAGFEVQASADGKNYEAVGFVASQNSNSTSAQRYAFAHKTAGKEGLVYYRLKQVDLDGTFEYYTAKVVDLGKFNQTVATYPNPFLNQFELNLTAATAETAQITVTDMTGKTVYSATEKLTKGNNTLKVNLENKPAGLYLLKATAGNQTYTNRLVKQ